MIILYQYKVINQWSHECWWLYAILNAIL